MHNVSKQVRVVEGVRKALRNRKKNSHQERQIRTDGKQILEIQMASQEGIMTL